VSIFDDIEKSKESGQFVIFLGGYAKDNNWRNDIKEKFSDSFSFIDPYDENWTLENNVYAELAGASNAHLVVFYNPGEGSKREIEFLELIDEAQKAIVFDDYDELIDYFEKFKNFLNEMIEIEIEIEEISEALNTYGTGAESEHSISKITKINAWTCKVILDSAYKYNILDIEDIEDVKDIE